MVPQVAVVVQAVPMQTSKTTTTKTLFSKAMPLVYLIMKMTALIQMAFPSLETEKKKEMEKPMWKILELTAIAIE
jgi:hypothetical protein